MKREHKYSHTKVIRVHLETGIVERKYQRTEADNKGLGPKRIGKSFIIWRQVDCYTLGWLSNMRTCPKDYVKRLCQTAI